MSKFAYGEVRYIIKGKNKIVSVKKGDTGSEAGLEDKREQASA